MVLIHASDSTECRLTLQIGTLPDEIHGLQISFKNLQQVSEMDSEDVEVAVDGELAAFATVTEETDTEQEEELEEVAQAIAEPAAPTLGTTVSTGSASLAITMYDFSALWSFVHAAQVLYFMPVQNIKAPPSVKALWQSFGADFFELPNIAESTEDEPDAEESPGNWDLVEFETTNLLWNTGELLFITLVTLSLLPLFALSYIAFYKYEGVQEFFRKRVLDYKWCYFLRLGLEGYLEFLAAAVVCLGSVSFT